MSCIQNFIPLYKVQSVQKKQKYSHTEVTHREEYKKFYKKKQKTSPV